ERIEISDVVGKAIGDPRLSGLSEADQVGRDAMRHGRDVRNDVAPDVRRGRVAMQKQCDGGICTPGLAISHEGIERGPVRQDNVGMFAHWDSPCRLSLNTVAKAMVLKRCSAAALRSTFMRRIAPCHDASRKSASSSGGKLESISPAC